MNPRIRNLVALVIAMLFLRFAPAWWCGRGAEAWLRGDVEAQTALADDLMAFEARDDAQRKPHSTGKSGDRFAGEWALVTHQMIAIGLAEIILAHPELANRYRAQATSAARKSF